LSPLPSVLTTVPRPNFGCSTRSPDDNEMTARATGERASERSAAADSDGADP
jgi:hypothetical protein